MMPEKSLIGLARRFDMAEDVAALTGFSENPPIIPGRERFGAGHQVALPDRHTKLLELTQQLLILDALGNGAETDLLAQLNNKLNDQTTGGLRAELPDIGLIDLT